MRSLAGAGGTLLFLGAYFLLRHQRRLWELQTRGRRWVRRRVFFNQWLPQEQLADRWPGRFGNFWIPRDVLLRSPEDMYRYLLSDRFWRSWYAWCVRILDAIWAVFFVLFGVMLVRVAIGGPG